ncbi:methyl-accepting chemotaxis protein [uncultured Clostridium sp.]|uniref:methyl-accepting chemotaxis protein n=1 Tax=uncultured Clostridium sp. TaxID=59620 RepID=UPI0028E47373|nr:methyl-accepting chemotaxis protein [uncultured Clostridium sp.]
MKKIKLRKGEKGKKSIKSKILITPLVIILIINSILSAAAINVAERKIIAQMRTDGVNLAKQVSSEIGKNQEILTEFNEIIENQIRNMGKFINNNMSSVNNDYLKIMAQTFNVDEINVSDPSGKIIYSNIPAVVNENYDEKKIVLPVIKGEKEELMEDVRKSIVEDNYYKYGYIRKNGGGVIQIGILANRIEEMSNSMDLQKLLDDLAKDEGMEYALIIDKSLKVTAHSDKDRIGSTVDDIGSRTAAVDNGIHSSTLLYKDTIEVYDVLVPLYKSGVHVGALNVGLSMKNVQNAIREMIVIIVVISIICFILVALIMMAISKSIINPVKNLVRVSEKISNGEFDIEIDVKNNDELGALAKGFKAMCDSLKNTISIIKSESDKINDKSRNLNDNADKMTDITSEVALAVQDIAQGSSEQTGDLMEAVNYMSKLSEELQNINEKVSIIKNSSNETENKARIGKEEIDNLLKSIEDIKSAFDMVSNKINGLNVSVLKIGSITDVINSISEQTNLLALNAAIEAARAGEAGRGFAVVAEQVRSLAERSQDSISEIQDLVHNIKIETENVLETSNGVKNLVDDQTNIAESTKTSLNDMLDSIVGISPLIDDLYKSAENTIESKEIVLEKVKTISLVSEKTSAASEEIAASSEEMSAGASELSIVSLDLKEVSEKLNKETNKFKI